MAFLFELEDQKRFIKLCLFFFSNWPWNSNFATRIPIPLHFLFYSYVPE